MTPHEQRETLTVTDLTRVYMRAQDENGKWQSINALEATDAQFDVWAKSRMSIQGEGDWSLEERAKFCDFLWQQGALVLLKKDEKAQSERRRDALREITHIAEDAGHYD